MDLKKGVGTNCGQELTVLGWVRRFVISKLHNEITVKTERQSP